MTKSDAKASKEELTATASLDLESSQRRSADRCKQLLGIHPALQNSAPRAVQRCRVTLNGKSQLHLVRIRPVEVTKARQDAGQRTGHAASEGPRGDLHGGEARCRNKRLSTRIMMSDDYPSTARTPRQSTPPTAHRLMRDQILTLPSTPELYRTRHRLCVDNPPGRDGRDDVESAAARSGRQARQRANRASSVHYSSTVLAKRALWAGESFFALVVVGQHTLRTLLDFCASSRSNNSDSADSDTQADKAPPVLVRVRPCRRPSVADFACALFATLFAGRAAQLAGHQPSRVCCCTSTIHR